MGVMDIKDNEMLLYCIVASIACQLLYITLVGVDKMNRSSYIATIRSSITYVYPFISHLLYVALAVIVSTIYPYISLHFIQ